MADWHIATEDRQWYVYDKDHDNSEDLFVRSKPQAERLAETLNRYERNYDTLLASYESLKLENAKLKRQNEDLLIELERLRAKA